MTKKRKKTISFLKSQIEEIPIEDSSLPMFISGRFSIRETDLLSQGLSQDKVKRIIEQYKYHRRMSNSGTGFLGEWGYWMILQSFGLYKDGFTTCIPEEGLPKITLRTNKNNHSFPLNISCLIPGKSLGDIKDVNGKKIPSHFPYTCTWGYGAVPDMYIGPSFEKMKINDFEYLYNETKEGYRLIEVKTVSHIYKDFSKIRNCRNMLNNNKGYISSGKEYSDLKNIIEVKINTSTHRSEEEIIVIAQRDNKNLRGEHLGFLTLSELRKKRAAYNIDNTDYISTDWLEPGIDIFIQELKDRCSRYINS